MPDVKQHITDLAHICHRKGVRHVVISPGSRSAPLIRAFSKVYPEDSISLVDERSAAYFALGMAAENRQPTAMICTSGTAVLNYAPALAEAFHQHVPLVAITADRPREWIDQQANQTIMQPGIYHNYIKASYDLPQTMATDDDLWHVHRMINEGINLCMAAPCGPVHINVPLAEPLYGKLPEPSGHVRIITEAYPEIRISLSDKLIHEWKHARRILIIHGQEHSRPEVASMLSTLSTDERIVVMAENIANINGGRIIANPSLLFGLNPKSPFKDNPVEEPPEGPAIQKSQVNTEDPGFPEAPDLILYSGGQVVSAPLGRYLRALPPTKCWRVGTDRQLIDTFQQVTDVIPVDHSAVYRALINTGSAGMSSDFAEQWVHVAARANATLNEKLAKMPFSDITVIQMILSSMPEETLVMAGNSSVIRYMQLFPSVRQNRYFANRGVSGIDGCISTAAGIANASGKPTWVITGDQSFVYDSNAMWNKELPSNLRIVVLNNGGGGIFHLLKGPVDMPGFKKFMQADHPVNMAYLAAAFQLMHYRAANENDIIKQWNKFIHTGSGPAVFEIRTDPAVSASAYKEIFSDKSQD